MQVLTRFVMNRLDTDRRVMVLKCLTEGNGVRATGRLTGVSKTTILKFITDFGEFATWFQDKTLVDLPCTDIQIDEIWSFCGCKERNKETTKLRAGGDVWTWTTICRDTKVTPSWLVSDRGQGAAHLLMSDLASRIQDRVQISTDGYRAYIYAVKRAFGKRADFGRLVKQYGKDRRGFDVCIGADRIIGSGSPRVNHICTSHVEGANLNMRMSMRRFTRLSNGFSKKIENHASMVAIHFLNYNMMRKHASLGTAPAVVAEVLEKPISAYGMLEHYDDYRNQFHPVERPLRYRKSRDTPKTYTPEIPKTPWYLDLESGGPNPSMERRKPWIRYEDR